MQKTIGAVLLLAQKTLNNILKPSIFRPIANHCRKWIYPYWRFSQQKTAAAYPKLEQAFCLSISARAFKLEYLGDGTVRGVLDLKEEVCNAKCPEHRTEPTAHAEKKEMCPPEKEKKPTQDAKPEPEVNPL